MKEVRHMIKSERACIHCRPDGYYDNTKDCKYCKGTGFEVTHRKTYITIERTITKKEAKDIQEQMLMVENTIRS